jgi:hypothetical protein
MLFGAVLRLQFIRRTPPRRQDLAEPTEFFSGILGGFSTGDSSIKSGFSRPIASFKPFSLNPVPECDFAPGIVFFYLIVFALF